MKKTFWVGVFIFCSSSFCDAQNFAPVGAKWYYTHGQSGIPSSVFTSYTLVESVADTIIDSKNCSKLNVTYNNYQNQTFDTWFMYSDSQKIYYYSVDSSQFFLLYDFTKLAGDSFLIEGYNLNVYVDSVSSIDINGNVRKKIFTHTNSVGYDLSPLCIEGIGSIIWMFPTVDNYVTGPLRCYSDSVVGLYETAEASSCDFSIGISENNFSSQSITISPNPATENIFIYNNSNDEFDCTLFSMLGSKLKTIHARGDAEIKVSNITSGVYLLQIRSNGKFISKKQLVIH